MVDSEKVKVSKKQFAEVLYHWLSGFLTEKDVKKTAKELGFKIENNKDLKKIFEELFVLNMWLTVHTCESVFENENKRDECLDVFHHLVYNRHIEDKENSFNDWMMLISPRYVEYSKAMETERPSTPLWVVANVINKRLFEEIKKDLFFQVKVAEHIGLFIEHLGKAIKQYDIE